MKVNEVIHTYGFLFSKRLTTLSHQLHSTNAWITKENVYAYTHIALYIGTQLLWKHNWQIFAKKHCMKIKLDNGYTHIFVGLDVMYKNNKVETAQEIFMCILAAYVIILNTIVPLFQL